jgi:hypothetical protein
LHFFQKGYKRWWEIEFKKKGFDYERGGSLKGTC